MTPDQQDTRDFLETALRFFAPNLEMEQISERNARGDVATFKAKFGYGQVQYLQIHPNGKPAWDGERSNSA